MKTGNPSTAKIDEHLTNLREEIGKRGSSLDGTDLAELAPRAEGRAGGPGRGKARRMDRGPLAHDAR